MTFLKNKADRQGSTVSRAAVVQILAVVLTLLTIWYAWHRPEPKLGVPETQAELIESSEEKIFTFQAKMIIGLLGFVREQRPTDPDQARMLDATAESAADSLRATLGQPAIEGRTTQPSSSLLLKELIVARYLELDEPADRLCGRLSERPGGPQGVLTLAAPLCSDPSAEAAARSPESAEALERLGWFGVMYEVLEADSPVRADDLRRTVEEQAQRTFLRLLGVSVLGSIVVLVSLVTLLIFLFRVVTGKITLRFSQQGMPTDYALEIYCLYLAGMLLVPQIIRLIEKLGLGANIIVINLLAIALLSVLILWPALNGISFLAVRERLGLQAGTSVIREALVGPLAYLASIGPFFIVLILYSMLLMHFDVNPAQGAHPVVPIITEARDTVTLPLIALIAVVAAPIVEEIMFRGALYSWLRSRAGRFTAIVVSSFVFALVHPQGPVGLVPLTCIGMVLAFLREWRGTLTASMTAHACFNAGTLALVVLLFR